MTSFREAARAYRDAYGDKSREPIELVTAKPALDGAIAVLKGPEGPIDSFVFSPDGTRLATAAGDKTVRLWGLTNADIHASRIAAKAIRARLAPVVEQWFTGEPAAVKMQLEAAKATMSAQEWHEASNLVLIKANASR